MKTLFLKYYLAVCAFILGAAMSSLFLVTYYSAKEDKQLSDLHFVISGALTAFGLGIAIAGKNLEEKE
jgi:cytochrome bd-type quinol oxidase subunit 2